MDKNNYADERLEHVQREVSPSSNEKSTSSENEELLSAWSLRDQRSLMRRVDVRLIPICGVMYCVSLLDRTNLSNANIAGLGKELSLAKVNGVDRYVSDLGSTSLHMRRLLIGVAVYRCSGILYHIHYFSATGYGLMPKNRPTSLSLYDYPPLGYRNAGHGLCSRLDFAYRIAVGTGYLRGTIPCDLA